MIYERFSAIEYVFCSRCWPSKAPVDPYNKQLSYFRLVLEKDKVTGTNDRRINGLFQHFLLIPLSQKSTLLRNVLADPYKLFSAVWKTKQIQ